MQYFVRRCNLVMEFNGDPIPISSSPRMIYLAHTLSESNASKISRAAFTQQSVICSELLASFTLFSKDRQAGHQTSVVTFSNGLQQICPLTGSPGHGRKFTATCSRRLMACHCCSSSDLMFIKWKDTVKSVVCHSWSSSLSAPFLIRYAICRTRAMHISSGDRHFMRPWDAIGLSCVVAAITNSPGYGPGALK